MRRLLFGLFVLALICGAEAACNDCLLKIEPSTRAVCPGQKAEYRLVVTNAFADSRQFSFSAVGDVALLGNFPKEVLVGPYGEATINITLRPVEGVPPGAYRFTVTASAEGISDSDDGLLILQDCRAEVSAPSNFLTCPSAGGFEAVVSNNGEQADDFQLSLHGTCDAALDTYSVHLGPGESKEVYVDIYSPEGECSVLLGASGEYTSASSFTEVDIIECYALGLEVIPPVHSSCPCEEQEYTLLVSNTGLFPQDVSLAVSGLQGSLESDSIHLESGQGASVAFTPGSTCCLTEDRTFTVTAQSPYAKAVAQGRLEMRLTWLEISDEAHPEYEACSSISLAPDGQGTKDIACEAGEYPLMLRNTGYTVQRVTLEAKGLGDFTIQPKDFVLQPRESRPVALYVFPSDGPGTYSIQVDAKGVFADDSLVLDVDISGPRCSVGTQESREVETPTGAIFEAAMARPDAGNSVAASIDFNIDNIALVLGIFTLLLGIYVFAELFRKKPEKKRKLTMEELYTVRAYKDRLMK